MAGIVQRGLFARVRADSEDEGTGVVMGFSGFNALSLLLFHLHAVGVPLSGLEIAYTGLPELRCTGGRRYARGTLDVITPLEMVREKDELARSSAEALHRPLNAVRSIQLTGPKRQYADDKSLAHAQKTRTVKIIFCQVRWWRCLFLCSTSLASDAF